MTAVRGRAGEVKRGLEESVWDDRAAPGADGGDAVRDALPIPRQTNQQFRPGGKVKQSHLIVRFE